MKGLCPAYALPGFTLPFGFVHSPAPILAGPWPQVLPAVVTAVAGVVLLTAALTGHWLVPCTRLERALFFAAALVLIKPGWMTDVLGLALALVGLRTHLARRRA